MSGVFPKYAARWLFGRRFGATLLVDTFTERGMRGRTVDGMSVAGTLAGTDIEVRTGKKDGGWQLTTSRVPGDKTDAIIAEKALKLFVRKNASGQKLVETARLLGLFDEDELRERVQRRLLDPNWHKQVDENDPNVIELEQWITSEWTAENPLQSGEEEEP